MQNRHTESLWSAGDTAAQLCYCLLFLLSVQLSGDAIATIG